MSLPRWMNLFALRYNSPNYIETFTLVCVGVSTLSEHSSSTGRGDCGVGGILEIVEAVMVWNRHQISKWEIKTLFSWWLHSAEIKNRHSVDRPLWRQTLWSFQYPLLLSSKISHTTANTENNRTITLFFNSSWVQLASSAWFYWRSAALRLLFKICRLVS